jgi:signal transduction histidine kinase/ligand-binding sensor domain-containing protein
MATAALGERLPIRVYTTADGLADGSHHCLVRDSTGFLWICTDEGLSRFDGYSFTNYSFSDGARAAVDFLQSRTGDYWVAQAHALCRFNPLPRDGQPRFECYRPEATDVSTVQIAEAPEESLWYLTDHGLYQFHAGKFQSVAGIRPGKWTTLYPDSDGSLWLGAEQDLVHLCSDGRVERLGAAEGLPVNFEGYFRVAALLRDRESRLWVATWQGLCLMTAHPEAGKRSVAYVYTVRDGLPGEVVSDVYQSSSGTLWATNEKGLSEWLPGAGGPHGRFRSYTTRNGFDMFGIDGPALNSLNEDQHGNLWMAGQTGPIRLARGGFVTYSTQDGLDSNRISSIVEDRDGRLIAITEDPRPRHLNAFDGQSFHTVLPLLPAGIHYFTWGDRQIHFQDHAGAWWVAAVGAVCRYPKDVPVEGLAHALPVRVYTARDGLPSREVFRMFEDSRGDVWISTIGGDGLARWSRSMDKIEVLSRDEDGRHRAEAMAFAEDRAGNVWMSFYTGGLARYRNGRFEVFTAAEGLPSGHYRTLLIDDAGRLWIASSSEGLIRVDHPTRERPQFRFYTMQQGLAANSVGCITQDRWGRIYTCSNKGIDQLDPESGRVRHFGESAGLISLGLKVAYRDRRGDLWFGGETLARFVPEPDAPVPAPTIRITHIGINGSAMPISEMGAGQVEGMGLRAGENHVQIEFCSLNFAVGETIGFQYKLEGAGQDWSPRSQSRSVDYASLSPGSYRFAVRAVNTEGVASITPASVAFVILPPLWQRWWFVAVCLAMVSIAVAAIHRYRLRQALELERMRTRIATDLHDDVGSSLTQIAILSEVARRNGGGHGREGSEPLERIANLSRELVDSMSDIVWAINPQRDRLSDLEYRMRRFASDVLAARDIDFELETPEHAADIPVRAEIRREVYLVFKESIHNVVRHSGCARVRVTLENRDHRLVLRLSDDGKGFAVPSNGHGHGLASMRQRAADAGGALRIDSEPGRGTTVTLEVPLTNTYLHR